MQILLRLTSKSEKKFFEILSRNSHVSLRELNKKIHRMQVYRIIQKIEKMQKNLDFQLIERQFDTSKITSLPVVNLEIKKMIELKEFDNENWVVIG
jgi:hypothetical protein